MSRNADLWAGIVLTELDEAVERFPAFNSPHEGWAVIREELDELWDHCKANSGRSTKAANEAVQIAAMALRYLVDIIPPERAASGSAGSDTPATETSDE